MVNVYAVPYSHPGCTGFLPGGCVNVDVHASSIVGNTVSGANGFTLSRYASGMANQFWEPPQPSAYNGSFGTGDSSALLGMMVPGNFYHRIKSGFGEASFIFPLYGANSAMVWGPEQIDIAFLH